MLKHLDEGDHPQALGGMGIANHVNLWATVSLKTECHLPEPHPLSGGALIDSLHKRFTFKKVNSNLNPSLPAPDWLKFISNYLCSNDYASGLFSLGDNPNDFIATYFSLGKYDQVLLSLSEL